MKISPEQAAINTNISEIESIYFNNVTSHDKKRGNAFQFLCLSVLCDSDYEDIEDEDIIDGNDEEGIDIIHHEEIDNRINVTIINCKSSKSSNYSANDITKIEKGLKYAFSESKNIYSQLKNTKLKNNISYIRNEKQKIYDVNVFYCVFNGSSLATNVDRKIKEIKTWFDKYFQDQFRNATFNFYCLNSCELFVIKNKNKESLRDIEIELEYYDKGKRMRPEVKVHNGIDGYVTTFNAKEISKIVDKYGDKLFEKNIRGWLKSKNKTNIEILDSCISENSNWFWFMNNGITIVGDDVFPDDDDGKWKIKNLQIVNGQQTARTLYEASRIGKLKDDVKIMCRIYNSNSSDFINLITKATNTQTSIGSRDLMSNEPKQIAIENLFEKSNYFYQRQRGQRRTVGIRFKKTITSKKLAQIGLAILCKKPSLARKNIEDNFFNPNKYYNEIFDIDPNILLLAFLVYNYCYTTKDIKHPITYYGILHIARLLWHFEKDIITKDINSSISKIEKGTFDFSDNYKKAVNILKELLDEEKIKKDNYSSYFSRVEFDEKLYRKL